jgi:hypothetical protein
MLDVSGQKARIHIHPQPQGLQPFQVEVSGLRAEVLQLEMRMQGMQMPPMRIDLQQQRPALWAVTTFLPVCVAGRRDWLWILWVDEQAVPLALTF